jgi:hypothetical protein
MTKFIQPVPTPIRSLLRKSSAAFAGRRAVLVRKQT